MIGKITELDGVVGKLESLIKTFRDERDKAVGEADRLKKVLDDRELELLQMDEQLQKESKRIEEERQAMMREHADYEQKLGELATRIRELLPLLTDAAAPSGGSQTTLNYDEA
ncbi:MAG: hypothetical protein LBS93_06675 [Synergistaceae bacterium]|jgi:predicted  nucleic acid-binding Zn-ribbon protein|nr:hypothetical protein [Synergistaceae bacterium]